jgi:hypothetical protein
MNIFVFDLETTGLLQDEGSEITTYGGLGKDGALVTSNVEEFVQFYLRQKSYSKTFPTGNAMDAPAYPDFRLVSFNGKNFDVPFLKKQFPDVMRAPPLLLDFFMKDAQSDAHIDLLAASAKAFNVAARDLTIEEVQARMNEESKLRIHKDDACGILDIYVPRGLPARACAIIGRRFLAEPDNPVIRRRFNGVLQHNAHDLFATYELYECLYGEGWVK